MQLHKGSLMYGAVIVICVFIAITSAQITFSRQWVRGKYPGDSEGGESPEFQRAAKAVFPMREAKRTISRFTKPDYVPILMNTHVLEEIIERMKEPPVPLSLENTKK